MGHLFTWAPGLNVVGLVTYMGSYVARTVPEMKSRVPQRPLTIQRLYGTSAALSMNPGTPKTATNQQPLWTSASPSPISVVMRTLIATDRLAALIAYAFPLNYLGTPKFNQFGNARGFTPFRQSPKHQTLPRERPTDWRH